MQTSKAFVPSTILDLSNKTLAQAASVILGVVMLALLAQLKISLPWTPVPITGQTFGVALLALLWGSRLSLITFISYLSIGFLGAPIFAGGMSGFSIGPTFGYLVGMIFSSWIVGILSDRGWIGTFTKALLACYLGSFITLSCGALGLAFFLPMNKVLIAGVLPFLPGDLLKNILAATIIGRFKKA